MFFKASIPFFVLSKKCASFFSILLNNISHYISVLVSVYISKQVNSLVNYSWLEVDKTANE